MENFSFGITVVGLLNSYIRVVFIQKTEHHIKTYFIMPCEYTISFYDRELNNQDGVWWPSWKLLFGTLKYKFSCKIGFLIPEKNPLKRQILQHSVTIISKVSFPRCHLTAFYDLCKFYELSKLVFLAS